MSKPFDWLRDSLSAEQRETIKGITVKHMKELQDLVKDIDIDLNEPLEDQDDQPKII